MKAFISSILIITAFTIPLSSGAWGLTGHRVVGEIAQHHLTKKTRKALKEILDGHGLAYWSNWPDFIKSDTTHTWDHASKWHYVDLPGHMQREAFIDSLEKLPPENLYTQIPAMVAQVKDKSLPVETRRNALAFVIHLVGDLHQPLHVGRDEDQGGNKIPVTWFDKKMNLHNLWDSQLIDFQQYSYTEFADNLDVLNDNMQRAITSSALQDWFYESHQLSDKIYDLTPADSKLSYKYNYLFLHDLEGQLLKGGLRLAKVLNEAFD